MDTWASRAGGTRTIDHLEGNATVFDLTSSEYTAVHAPVAVLTQMEEATPFAARPLESGRRGPTEFVGHPAAAVSWSRASTTRFANDRVQPEPAVAREAATPGSIAKFASTRGILLAKKFGSGVDREEASRLVILTERLRKLVPRVDPAEVDALAGVAADIEAGAVRAAAIRERLSRL